MSFNIDTAKPLECPQTGRGEGALLVPHERESATCWLAAGILIGFLCLTQLGMMTSLLAGRIGMAWVAPAALLLALIGGDQMGRRMNLGGLWRLSVAALVLIVIAVAVAMSASCFDLSFDGQWYHQRAVLQMEGDWNPLVEPMRRDLIKWTPYFSKGPWYVAAAIYQLTGQIEWGKCTTWITWAAMVLSAFAAGLDWRLRRMQAAAIAVVVALHPVVMSEISSYLVDGVMMATLLVLIAAVFSGLRRPRTIVVLVGILAAIFCANTKQNGLIYECIVFAAGGLWCLFRRREWLLRYTGLVLLALVLGVGVFGYNPYVTNTIYRHNPLYPAVGTDALEKVNNNLETPKNMVDRNRFVRLGYAIFGRPGNAPYAGMKNAELMWPFTASLSDIAIYRFQEGRIAFFGPYFSGALLLALGLMTWLMLQQNIPRLFPALAALTIIASLLLSPLQWWPRIGPQLWLLPLVPVIAVFLDGRSHRATCAAWVLVVLMIVNGGIVAGVGLTWEINASRTLRGQLAELHESGKTIEVDFRQFEMSMEEKLKTWDVPYQKMDPKKKFRDGSELMSVVDGYPGTIRYRVLPPGAARPPE